MTVFPSGTRKPAAAPGAHLRGPASMPNIEVMLVLKDSDRFTHDGVHVDVLFMTLSSGLMGEGFVISRAPRTKGRTDEVKLTQRRQLVYGPRGRERPPAGQPAEYWVPEPVRVLFNEALTTKAKTLLALRVPVSAP